MKDNDKEKLSDEIEAQLDPIGDNKDLVSSQSVDLEQESQQQSQISVSPTLPSSIVVPPKSPSKVKYVIIAVIVFIILGVGGFFAYMQFFSPKPAVADTKTQPTVSVKPKAEKTAYSTIDTLKKELKGNVSEGDANVSYKVPNARVWLMASQKEKVEGFNVISTKRATRDQDLKSVQDGLLAEGMKLILKSDTTQAEDDLYTRAHYTSDTIACSISNDAEGDFVNKEYVISKYTTYVGCVDIANMANTLKEYAPFVKAVDAGTNMGGSQDNDGTQISDLKIADSKTAGYQTAQMTVTGPIALVGGGMGLYYKAPNQDWKSFRVVQSVLNCSDYDTNDLKNAFVGAMCYEGEVESVVRAAKV